MAKQKKKPIKIKTAFTKEELEKIFRSEKDEETFAYVPIFAVSLSGQSSLYGDIDRLYEENEYEYHLIYNESPYKDIYTLHSLNLEAEFYVKRLLALFEYDLKIGEGRNTYTLFTKLQFRFPNHVKLLKQRGELDKNILAFELFPLESAYNNKTHNQSVLPFVEDVRSFFAKKHSTFSFLLDDRLIFDYIMIFLAKGLGLPLINNGIEALTKADMVSLLETRGLSILSAYLEALSEKADKEPALHQIRKEIMDSDLMPPEMMRHIGEAFNFKDVVLLEPTYLYSYSFFDLVRLIEIQENYMLPSVVLPFKKKEAEKEIAQILALSPHGEEEMLQNYYFVYIGLFLKRIVQEMKRSKQFYFDKENNEAALEIKRLQEELEKQKQINENLSQQVAKYEKEQRLRDKEEQGVWSEEHQRSREFERRMLEAEKQVEEQNEELHYLREYVYSLEKEFRHSIQEQSTEGTIEFIEKTKKKKVVVIGGHPNWKTNIRQVFPDIHFIDRDTSFSKNHLQNADFVYYAVEHMSHGLFYRVHPVVKKEDVPFGFLPSGNLDVTIQSMKYEWDRKENNE